MPKVHREVQTVLRHAVGDGEQLMDEEIFKELSLSLKAHCMQVSACQITCSRSR